ncbi:hypothetical protein FPV67DRAFT_1524136 [Lyophyllum atratum]|nr:hypothetical protein FPV67DRAFT_1524136 [Lyophyllum atratum]
MSSQMPSLTQSIEAMSLQPPRNPTKPITTATPDQIHLPVPRRTPAAKNHHILYGFAVSDEWLVNYCDQNAHRVINYDPELSSGSKVYLALKLLRLYSRYKALRVVNVICNARDPSLELQRTAPGGSVPLLSVCSSMRSSYKGRPSQAQMDVLRSIIQQEPDWYVDVNPPSSYGGYI